MKVFPGDLLMRASRLGMEDRGRYYELVFHLWSCGTLSMEDIDALVGPPSPRLLAQFQARKDGKYGLDWVDEAKAEQGSRAERNSLNRRGKAKTTTRSTTGSTSGKTSRSTSGGTPSVPVPVPDAVPSPAAEAVIFPSWATEVFRNKWKEFAEYKKSQYKFSYKGVPQEQQALRLLEQAYSSEGACVAALNEAMARGWRWPVNSDRSTATIGGGASMTKEEAEAELREIRLRNGRDPVLGATYPQEKSERLRAYEKAKNL